MLSATCRSRKLSCSWTQQIHTISSAFHIKPWVHQVIQLDLQRSQPHRSLWHWASQLFSKCAPLRPWAPLCPAGVIDQAGKFHESELNWPIKHQDEYSIACKEAYPTCVELFSASCSALLNMKLPILVIASSLEVWSKLNHGTNVWAEMRESCWTVCWNCLIGQVNYMSMKITMNTQLQTKKLTQLARCYFWLADQPWWNRSYWWLLHDDMWLCNYDWLSKEYSQLHSIMKLTCQDHNRHVVYLALHFASLALHFASHPHQHLV